MGEVGVFSRARRAVGRAPHPRPASSWQPLGPAPAPGSDGRACGCCCLQTSVGVAGLPGPSSPHPLQRETHRAGRAAPRPVSAAPEAWDLRPFLVLSVLQADGTSLCSAPSPRAPPSGHSQRPAGVALASPGPAERWFLLYLPGSLLHVEKVKSGLAWTGAREGRSQARRCGRGWFWKRMDSEGPTESRGGCRGPGPSSPRL